MKACGYSSGADQIVRKIVPAPFDKQIVPSHNGRRSGAIRKALVRNIDIVARSRSEEWIFQVLRLQLGDDLVCRPESGSEGRESSPVLRFVVFLVQREQKFDPATLGSATADKRPKRCSPAKVQLLNPERKKERTCVGSSYARFRSSCWSSRREPRSCQRPHSHSIFMSRITAARLANTQRPVQS